MEFSRIWLGLIVSSCFVAFGQTSDGKKLAFEVATVKPSSADALMQVITSGGIPFLTVKGDRVHVGPAIMSNLILEAYKIQRYQLEGPKWLVEVGDVRPFEIDAKLPAGATPDQAHLMLQTLLEERFGLRVHRGSVLIDGYALVVGKEGSKLRAKDATDSATAAKRDEKGILKIGDTKIWFGPPAHVETTTIAGLIRYLSLGGEEAAVLDKTGLQGSFDIQLDIPAPDRNDVGAEARLSAEDATARKMAGLAEPLKTLGLKLERQKSPVETIVVDHVEKAPTAN